MTASRKSDEQKPWRILWALAAPYRSRMVLLALVSMAGALFEAGFLVLLTSTVFALAGLRSTIGPILGVAIDVRVALILAAAAIFVRLGLGLWGVRVSSSLTEDVTADHRHRLAGAYLGASWEVQQAEPSGRLQELLTSFVNRVNGAMSSISQGISASLSLIAFLSAGLLVDPLSTAAVLMALLGLGAVLAPLRRQIRARSGEQAQSSIAFARSVAELGTLGQEMQTFGVREQFAGRVAALSDASTENARRVQVLSGALTPVYTFLAYAAVVAGITVLSLVGVGDLAAVGSVMLLMLRSLSYGQQLLAVSGAMAASLPFLERLRSTLAVYEASPASQGGMVPDHVTPLGLRDVSFAYPGGREALVDVDLTIARGETIGVIGPSGAGKSTLAQLLLGLRDPSMGAVTAGGIDLREVDRAWWTQHVAFVAQDPLLFTGTVAENIRFFREGFSETDLELAATQANVLADIRRLQRGFGTHLGERGSQLSGGQRQRLSIARALVGRPELLILDEPTSALDGQSEILIRDTLAELHGRITTVIIAHRMSTLDLCNRIVVIEGGRISAIGSPEALRDRSEFYRNALSAAGIA